VKKRLSYAAIYPRDALCDSPEKREAALGNIYDEMVERAAFIRAQNKLIEAQRIEERTKYDLEMLREFGFCSGGENYSRVLSGRPEGSTPYTLLDYFPDDFLMFIDESHVTLPQVRGMSGGDRARKEKLIENGFSPAERVRQQTAYLRQFEKKLNQTFRQRDARRL
jgi:excinuclease ABC subunit B